MTAPNADLVARALRHYAETEATSADDANIGRVLADSLDSGRLGIVAVAPPVDDSTCDELGDAELCRNALRYAAIRAAAGGHVKCAERAQAIATRLEAANVDELFGQTRTQIEEAWRERERENAPRYADAGYELFPRGAGPDTPSDLAELVWQSGALYAINRGVLHTLGLALGIEADNATGRVVALLLARTADPEGITFDELSREQGRGRFTDRELASVLTTLRELDAELDAELKARGRGDGIAFDTAGDREAIDAALVARLVEHGPRNRYALQSDLGLTNAQTSAALLRLTSAGAVVENSEGAYSHVEAQA